MKHLIWGFLIFLGVLTVSTAAFGVTAAQKPVVINGKTVECSWGQWEFKRYSGVASGPTTCRSFSRQTIGPFTISE